MTIVVVGLGLIGGSLAGACRKKFPKARIIGVTRNRAALATAKRKGWIHEGCRDLESAFQNAGPCLILLCTPVDTLKGFLLRLDRIAPPGSVVTDTGSVKGFLVRWAEKRRLKRIHFVGAHPMAGSHERGIRNANSGLFKGSTTFVTPARNANATQAVVDFWKKISDRVVMIDAGRHDRITAEISHLPHFLASVLVMSVSGKAMPFASTGFLDTTRVAQGAGDLWVPILFENQREVCRALSGFETRLAEFKKILARKDGHRLLQLLNQAGVRRKRIKLISRGLLL